MTEVFQVSGHELHFDEVAVNDAPCYRWFVVRNVVCRDIIVRLESSLTCLTFQIRNENVVGGEVVSSRAIFDEVEVVSQVKICALSSVEVLCKFRADTVTFLNAGAQGVNCNGVVTVSCEEQIERISFASRVFLSTMLVTPTELHCSMSGGKSQIVEFVVANTSSRELQFVLRQASKPSKHVQADISEGESATSVVFGQRLTMEPHGSRRFSLIVRTSLLEHSKQQALLIQCDNLRDSRNTFYIQVTVNLTDNNRSDLLTFAENALEFGDVYRGATTVKTILLTNGGSTDVTLKPVRSKNDQDCDVCVCIDDDVVDEVTISAQRSMKVGFQLKTTSSKDRTSERFRIDIDCLISSRTRQQLATVRCSGTLHTSKILVSQPSINFGDCQVGQSRKAVFIIENLSPLQGCASLHLRSKIISIDGVGCKGEREQHVEVTLAPQSHRVVELSILPQRVNPTYRKQLIVCNKFNGEERFTLNIEANNMAPRETKLHDDLYVWECVLPVETQLRAVCGAPLIVPYIVKSKSSQMLTLFLSTTSTEIDIFVLEVDSPELRQRFDSACSALNCEILQGDDVNCDAVTTAREELMGILGQQAKSVDTIGLHPFQELRVFARILRSGSQITDFQTKEDGILVRMDGVDLPRFVRLSYRLCSTLFEISGQRTKNFGDVNIGEKKVTKLSIVNKCKTVLYFSINKSRSVTASHVRVGKSESDRQTFYSVVRPFAVKDVDISFLPGIKGLFEEKLKVSNVLDPTNEVVVTVKAQVTKLDTFDVAPESWSFGEVTLADDGCRVGAKLSVSNTSRQRREFRLRLDGSSQDRFFRFEGVDVRLQLEMEHVGSSGGSTKKIEEQVEKLEQKLKIYIRKQKTEKVDAARKRIEALRRALQGEEIEIGDDQDFSSSEDESSLRKSRISHSELVGLLAREGVALPTLGPSESVSLTLLLQCQRTSNDMPSVQTSSINVMIFEAKDQEINKVVPVDLTLVCSQVEGAALRASVSQDKRVSLLQLHSTQAFSFLDCLLIPLHNTLLNDWSSFKILISTNHETTYVVLEPYRCGGSTAGFVDAKFRFSPRNGVVRFGEQVGLAVDCFPRCPGPQRYIVPVKNIKNPSDVQHFCVELNPVVDEDLFDVDPRSLDFQNVVMPLDKTEMTPKTVTIRNKGNSQLTLLVRSNRPSLMIFRDSACSEALANPLRLLSKGVARVYCKLIPSSKACAARAESFVGGISVESIEAANDSFSTTSSCLVRIQGVVGTGEIRVEPLSIDMGVVPHGERSVSTCLTVKNTSQTFTVGFKCFASSNAVLFERAEGSLSPQQEIKVFLQLRLANAGLFQESVTIVNTSCAQETMRVSLTALKQDGAITMNKTEVVFPVVAVERFDAGLKLLCPVKSGCTISNHSAKDMILVARTSLPVVLGDVSHERKNGGRVRVDAKQQVHIEWQLVDTPSFTAKEINDMSVGHGVVTVHGVAQVEVGQVIDENRYSLFRLSRNLPTVGQCVLVPKFVMSFAMSEGAVEPREIDVGSIGKPQEVSFLLKNLSRVLPLRVRILCEPTVRIAKHVTIEPLSSATVKGQLDVEAIRTQGQFRYNVCFVNELNSENDITSTVTGRFYRKLFRISLEGCQSDDDIHSITLPTIKVDPSNQGGSTSETKLGVSCSEQNINLQMNVVISEAFFGIVTLQTLRYDATEVVETLTFQGKVHNVRLRCTTSDAHLSKLLGAFFGARPKPLSTLSFDDVVEIEKWRFAVSPVMWLGSIQLSNDLTKDEELDVYTSMQAVTTFAISASRILLKRVSQDSKKSIFHGKLSVSNTCQSHLVSLLTLPCVSSRCNSVVTLECLPQRASVVPGKECHFQLVVTAERGTESNVEEGMALVVVDENVVMSGQCVRCSIVAVDGLEDGESALLSETTEQVCGASLDLMNCAPVAGAEGSFSYSMAAAKDSEANSDVRVHNISTVNAEYSCTVVAQTPHPWLQLPTPNGKLKPQESQALKFLVCTSEVGTYFAHVVVNSSLDPSEVLVLRITCDVYTASGENLYDIATSGGKVSGQHPVVNMGVLFCEHSLKCSGFDIVNKSSEPLEFQLSVMKPYRVFQRKLSGDEVQLSESGVKLQLHLPQEAVHHTYVVVDPRSKQRVLFVSQSERVFDPVVAEIEVAVKCKVARDMHHIIKARFDILPSNFRVSPQHITVPSMATLQVVQFTLLNLSSSPQTLLLKTDSALLTLPQPDFVLQPASSVDVEVLFNPQRCAGVETGVEERVSVICLGDSRERTTVTVSWNRGRRPWITSGAEHEKLIHQFARQFSLLWSREGSEIITKFGDTAADGVISEIPVAFSYPLEEYLLLVAEAQWLADEVIFFSSLLRNSRTFAALGQMLANVVVNHPVIKSWKLARRQGKVDASVQCVLNRFAEIADILAGQ